MIQISGKSLKDLLKENERFHQTTKLQPIQLPKDSVKRIRIFISSTFLDTKVERDLIVNKIIPELNLLFHGWNLEFIPTDLRQGVDEKQYGDYCAIQKLCFDKIDECRIHPKSSPWFIGLRTKRYGWVERKLLESDSYNHKWINTLRQHSKTPSITSLECIHAIQPVEFVHPVPTVFFYERVILNKNEIDLKSRWIYDFNYKYTGPCDETQYTITPDARSYKEDMNSLNDCLRSSSLCKFQNYSCTYQKGIDTDRSMNRKRMNAGMLADLHNLKEKIVNDLIEAVHRCFTKPD